MSGMATPGVALLTLMAETRFEALPKSAVEMGRLAVLDWWGVTVGGVDEPVTRLLREAVPEPPGPASVLGTDRTASPITAALWNGTADLDESQARAVVRLRDGSVLEQAGDLRRNGDPERLRWELGEKFQALTEPRLGARESVRLRDALGRVEEIEDLAELTGPAWRRGS